MVGGHEVVAVGRATIALPTAQEMVHTSDNDDKNTTAQQRQNSASDWALGAYGSTFVLAPSFCLRLGAEDSLLLAAAIQHEGLAVLLQSELSGRRTRTRTLTQPPSVCSHFRRCHSHLPRIHRSSASRSLALTVAGPSSLATT